MLKFVTTKLIIRYVQPTGTKYKIKQIQMKCITQFMKNLIISMTILKKFFKKRKKEYQTHG